MNNLIQKLKEKFRCDFKFKEYNGFVTGDFRWQDFLSIQFLDFSILLFRKYTWFYTKKVTYTYVFSLFGFSIYYYEDQT